MEDISKDETKVISKLERFILESKERLKRTREIMEQLKDGEYTPDILKVLFDYGLFERVFNGEFDSCLGNPDRFKEECRAYMSMANRVKKEVKGATGVRGMAKKVHDSERYRLAILESEDDGEETLRKLKESDTVEILMADEKTMHTYTALAKDRLRVEYSLLNYLRSKQTEGRIGSRRFESKSEDFEGELEPED